MASFVASVAFAKNLHFIPFLTNLSAIHSSHSANSCKLKITKSIRLSYL